MNQRFPVTQYPDLDPVQQQQLLDDEAVLHSQNICLHERVKELENELDCVARHLDMNVPRAVPVGEVVEWFSNLDSIAREEYLAELREGLAREGAQL